MEPPCPCRLRRRRPQHSGTSFKIARCIQQRDDSAGAVSGTERLRGANQVAIIAKAARLVLPSCGRARIISKRRWRSHACSQTDDHIARTFSDPHACAQRLETRAAAIRASYRGAGAGATDCTSRSRSAAAILDDRCAAGARSGAGKLDRGRCHPAANSAIVPMHLFGAGNLDRVGGNRFVIELYSRAAVCARSVRQLFAERERAVVVPTANVGQHTRFATANDLQWHRVLAARPGLDLGGTIGTPATLADNPANDSMLAMRLQLRRRRACKRGPSQRCADRKPLLLRVMVQGQAG